MAVGDEQAANTNASAASTVTTSATALSDGPGHGTGPSDATAGPSLKSIRRKCLCNMRYHMARESHLDGCHRWLMFFILVFGASALVDLFPDVGWVKPAAGAAVATLAALDMVFDLSNRARGHALQRRRYSELLAKVERDPPTIAEADAELSILSGDEEPVYHALFAGCFNAAETMVFGDSEDHVLVPAWHKPLQNFLRFEGSHYPPKHPRTV